MALGTVEVIQQNLGNGALPEVERTFCFIGRGDVEATHGTLFSITPTTDLEATFGVDSILTHHLKSAILNANTPNFFAYAISISAVQDWKTILKPMFDKPTDLDVEAIAVCGETTTKSDVEVAESFVIEIASAFGKQISVHLTTAKMDTENETWTQYITKLKAITSGVVCPHVSVVANLHGNNLGVVSGRLCNPAVTIGDSPMRVATGALVGLGDASVDSEGVELAMSHLIELSNARISVPQWYAGYPGIYWGDHPMLDAPGGDFQVYEYLRCVQAAARRVRILAIKKVADRVLNSSAKSIAFHQTYFEKPLRDMSKGVIIAGVEFPGAIQAPKDGDVSIKWTSLTEVNIVLLIAPVACPKKIKAYLALDLNRL